MQPRENVLAQHSPVIQCVTTNDRFVRVTGHPTNLLMYLPLKGWKGPQTLRPPGSG